MFFLMRQSRSAPLPCARVQRAKPKKFRSGQAQHALLEAGKDGFARCDLTRRVARHLAAEQYVRAILHQGDETDLRKGAAAPAGAGPPESFVVGRFIGDVEGTAVQAQRTPAAVPGSFGRKGRRSAAPPRRGADAPAPSPAACG